MIKVENVTSSFKVDWAALRTRLADIKTNIATPELMACVEQAEALGYRPRRARLTCLSPGQQSSRHRDGLPTARGWRMQFVIETNPQSVLITDTHTFHLPAGLVCVFNVNDWHQVKNLGKTDRTHLIMDVTPP